MFVNPVRSIKNQLQAVGERWRNRKGQAVIPAPAPKEKPFKVPYTSTKEVKDVDFKLAPEVTVFDYRECQSHAKMNRTRAHRQALKKFHKHQARCNKNYRVKA